MKNVMNKQEVEKILQRSMNEQNFNKIKNFIEKELNKNDLFIQTNV
jgi:hypothetical protein